MKKILSLLSVLGTALALCSCKVNWFTTTIDVPWYLMIVYVGIPFVLIFAILYKAMISKTYVCPHCKAEFKPKWYQLSICVHFMGKRLIKCPECKRTSYCASKK